MKAPPEHVTLIYRAVGPTHVFTSSEWSGFHIGSHDLRDAFNQAIEALGEYVTELYGCEATYVPEMTFETFEKHLHRRGKTAQQSLADNFVTAKLAEMHRGHLRPA